MVDLPSVRRFLAPAPMLGLVLIVIALLVVPVSEASFVATTGNTANTLATDTLDPPTALSGTGGVTATVDWTATVDGYATGHRVYRSSSAGGPYSQIAEIADPGIETYDDSSAEGTYYYVARAYMGTWESTNSNEGTARIWRAFDCPSDPDLRACIRFDNDVSGFYLDGSGNGNDATTTGGSQVDGISDKAAFGAPGAHYEIADSASLDLTTAMTMEVWLKLDSLPGSGRVGILDKDGQYSLFVYAGTGLRCSNGLNDLPHVSVPSGVWFHVACTWDGSDLTLYIDGVSSATMASTGTMDTVNTDGMSLLNSSPAWDEPADGAMDNLRIWHSARTLAQICADAGITGC